MSFFYRKGGLPAQKLLPILNKTELNEKNHRLFGSPYQVPKIILDILS